MNFYIMTLFPDMVMQGIKYQYYRQGSGKGTAYDRGGKYPGLYDQ